jgi:phenylalanyl-tRNA synthetase alpha chain
VPEKLKDRWIEVMGAGMLHPNVIKNYGLDPGKYRGFAFGGGLDRLAMLRWGIDDVRLMHSADLRFVNQF